MDLNDEMDKAFEEWFGAPVLALIGVPLLILLGIVAGIGFFLSLWLWG